MYKIPDLNDIREYYTDNIDEVIGFIFNLPWLDGPTAVWVSMHIYAMLLEGKSQNKVVRLIFKLPEDEGYDVWDLCPTSYSVTKQTVKDLKDATVRGKLERFWPTKVMMSNEINELIRIDEWRDCEEHREKEKPNLEVIEGGLLGDIDLSWTNIRKE